MLIVQARVGLRMRFVFMHLTFMYLLSWGRRDLVTFSVSAGI